MEVLEVEIPIGVPKELVDKVLREIEDHPKWCIEGCKTFLPARYLKLRLVECHTIYFAQNFYRLCHEGNFPNKP